MPKRSGKPPADPNKVAKSILNRLPMMPAHRPATIAPACEPDRLPEALKGQKFKHTYPKNPTAQALSRLGGLKGGKARRDSMTAEERKESARKAAEARWGKQQRATSQ